LGVTVTDVTFGPL
jgi:hypothetical protein